MSDNPLSPPAWLMWLLAVLSCVLFATTLEAMDWMTVTLVIGLMAAGGVFCVSLLVAPLLGVMDAWEEARTAAAAPPQPVEAETPAQTHQFSLKRMFIWMGAGALLWRILSGSITETPSLFLAMGVMVGIALAIDAAGVAMDLCHFLLQAVLQRVARGLRRPPEDSR